MGNELYIILALLGASAFFSASETAFTSLTIMQIKEVQKKKPSLGRLLEKLYGKPDLVITTILIGNNIVNTSIATLTTAWVESLSGNVNLALVTGGITLAILIFGEVTPKQVAIALNVPIASFSIRILYALSFIFRPVIWALSFVAKLISLIRGKSSRNPVTLDGILHLIQHARSIGLLDDDETRMVRGVFRFSDVSVHSIMTHRREVFSLPADLSLTDALPRIVDSGYTQVPLWEDGSENIVGILYEKDLLNHLSRRDESSTLETIMRDPLFVPESWTIQKVFARLKSERVTMAIVLDEYGGLAGLVTMTDIISQIIGDLDEERLDPHARFERDHASGALLVPGDEPLYHLEEIAGIDIPEARNGQNVAGYIEQIMSRIPEAGDSVETPLGHLSVKRMVGTRIDLLAFVPGKRPD